MHKRKICIITGTRAEYGRLYGLMKLIQKDENLTLQILATGMHLSPEFGLTYREIEKDGFTIDEEVEMILSSDTPVGVSKSIGLGIIGYADSYYRLKPDLVVILGDRYEAIGAAIAAMVANIPIAHIHGGEITEGAIDDSIRHSITKMSSLHFVSEPEYRRRVIQLGENPERVFLVGAPGNDNIVNMECISKEKLNEFIKFNLTDKFFLVTYHPVTIQADTKDDSILELFKALDQFPDYKLLFTKANSDAGGRDINKKIDQYAYQDPNRVHAVTSMGELNYLSAMSYCSAVIGNSSSGILEAPIFHKPTVNIGNRQTGRNRTPSILDCDENSVHIATAIKKAVSPGFKEAVEKSHIPFSDGKVADRIYEVIRLVNLEGLPDKKFYDI